MNSFSQVLYSLLVLFVKIVKNIRTFGFMRVCLVAFYGDSVIARECMYE